MEGVQAVEQDQAHPSSILTGLCPQVTAAPAPHSCLMSQTQEEVPPHTVLVGIE